MLRSIILVCLVFGVARSQSASTSSSPSSGSSNSPTGGSSSWPPSSSYPATLCTDKYYVGGSEEYYYDIASLTLPAGQSYSYNNTNKNQWSFFAINICGTVSCPGATVDSLNDIGGCQTSYNYKNAAMSQHSVGSASSGTLTANLDGDMDGFLLEYIGGDECSQGDVRSTLINVRCQSSRTVPELQYVGETSHCRYEFTLWAAAACPISTAPNPPPPPPPTPGVACTDKLYVDSSRYYPVSQLTVPEGSPYTTTMQKYLYSVNVCGSVTCSGTTVPSGTDIAVCQTDTASKKNKALGTTSTASLSVGAFEGDGYVLTYSDGDTCSNGEVRSTVVNVVCKPGLATPQLKFEGELVHCSYSFVLEADAGACLIDDTPEPPPVDATPCADVFTSPVDRNSYQVSSLRRDSTLPYTEEYTDANGHQYQFAINICGSVPCTGKLPAGTEAAGCQTWTDAKGTHSRIIGQSNGGQLSPSLATQGGYTVTYSDGDVCSSGTARSTIVEVLCSPTEATPKLTFVGETSHCVYEFQLASASGCAMAAATGTEQQPSDNTPKPKSKAGVVVGILLVVLLVVGGALGFIVYKRRQGAPAHAYTPGSFGSSGGFSCSNFNIPNPFKKKEEYRFEPMSNINI